MKPRFALDLTNDAVSLLERAEDGWVRISMVGFDDPAADRRLAEMRSLATTHAPDGYVSKLIIPNSQILYLEVEAPGPDRSSRRMQIRKALEGRTPYPVDDLVFDWSRNGAWVRVAVVARETLDEAEGFAEKYGFKPVAFVAAPTSGQFAGEPYFGLTSRHLAHLPRNEKFDRDQDPARMTRDEVVLASPPAEPPPQEQDVEADAVLSDTSSTAEADAGAELPGAADPLPDPPTDPLVEEIVVEEAPFIAVDDLADLPVELVEGAATEPAARAEPMAAVAVDAVDADEAITADSLPPKDATDGAPFIALDAEETLEAEGAPLTAPEISLSDDLAGDLAGDLADELTLAGETISDRDPGLPADTFIPAEPVLSHGVTTDLPIEDDDRVAGDGASLATAFQSRRAPGPSGQEGARLAAIAPRLASLNPASAATARAPRLGSATTASPPAGQAPALDRVVADMRAAPDPATPMDRTLVEDAIPISRIAARPSAATQDQSVFGAPQQSKRPGRPAIALAAAIAAALVIAVIAIWSFWSVPETAETTVATAPVPAAPSETNTAASLPSSQAESQTGTTAADGSAAPAPDSTASARGAEEAGAATQATAAAPAVPTAAPGTTPEAAPTGTASNGGADLPASVTGEPARHDATNTARLGEPASDQPLPAQPLPQPYGTLVRYDAAGQIIPTPDGVVTPDGYTLYAGKPPRQSKERPAGLVPPPPAPAPTEVPVAGATPDTGAQAADEAPYADPKLKGKLPRIRPADLEVPAPAPTTNGAADLPAATDQAAAPLPGPVDPRHTALQPKDRPARIAAAAKDYAQNAAQVADAAAAAARAEAAAAAAAVAFADATDQAVKSSRRPAARSKVAVAAAKASTAAAAAASAAVSAAASAATSAAVDAALAEAQAAPEPAAPAAKPAVVVQQQTASEVDEPEPQDGVPNMPTTRTVAKKATIANAIDLKDVNLIGIFGSSSNRRALVRMPGGRIVKVQVGDRLNGGQVAAIGDSELTYVKGGRAYVLKMLRAG